MARRLSIGQQIEELETTRDERKVQFDQRVARRQLGMSLAQYRTDRFEAALRTLRWLERHEAMIRQRCPELAGGSK
ncbi:hypothetical protein J2X65_002003 [Ancylobacter sp. 3268]|uniref:hypothetical protein n=1 Tax=Ancylobacter sp. 3268 TaxID=2817752 RepID=UPI00285B5E49|nr:hypothetical protein [Ancylobacter sp. 3268]MDR6952644.1 hypothetical protein [Ancylobacter sp. 3268]